MDHYDVAIMGGGPAGSTLAALLAKKTGLRIALIERERFPRDHIGQSFSHRIVGVLQESGALAKVLKSDCWIKKYGGYYAWNPEQPAVALFDHHQWKKDGVYRWSMHVNRAEFDQILYEHARDLGVTVFDETKVEGADRTEDGGYELTLSKGATITATIFVEAAGRESSFVSDQKKQWLSEFKNVAIWSHFMGTAPVTSIAGDWNIFREKNLSAVGNFAYKDGWCWYFPVNRWVDGKRVETISLGVITDGKAVREAGGDLRDPEYFVKHIREVPLLGQLLGDNPRAIDTRLNTATNYSMISDSMCNFEERWLRIGDAAYFVDPLFSSGVAFAMLHAQAACVLIKSTLEGDYSTDDQRELWTDYDTSLQRVAKSFSLGIDHWYHAIAERNPDSVYWKRRSGSPSFLIDHADFQSLVDTDLALPPDLRIVLGKGVGRGSPLDTVSGAIAEGLPSHTDRMCFTEPTSLAEGLTLGVGGSRGSPFPGEPPTTTSAFWKDPVANGDALRSHSESPLACLYFRSSLGSVKAAPSPETRELYQALSGGTMTFEQAQDNMAATERSLLVRLVRDGMVSAAAE